MQTRRQHTLSPTAGCQNLPSSTPGHRRLLCCDDSTIGPNTAVLRSTRAQRVCADEYFVSTWYLCGAFAFSSHLSVDHERGRPRDVGRCQLNQRWILQTVVEQPASVESTTSSGDRKPLELPIWLYTILISFVFNQYASMHVVCI